MALRFVQIGSMGPYPFDDGNPAHGLRTDKPPTSNEDVVNYAALTGEVGG